MNKELVKVKVDGTVFMCEMVQGEGGIDLTNAMEIRSGYVDREEADKYIKNENIKDLRSVAVGSASTYSMTNLSVDEKNTLRRRYEDMAIVKEHAMAITENRLFDEQK